VGGFSFRMFCGRYPFRSVHLSVGKRAMNEIFFFNAIVRMATSPESPVTAFTVAPGDIATCGSEM
jgi:hypothetical protein